VETFLGMEVHLHANIRMHAREYMLRFVDTIVTGTVDYVLRQCRHNYLYL